MEENEEEKQQKLSGDYSTPFSPPSGVQDSIQKDDQALDDVNDLHEWYDEGRDGAAEKTDPGNRGIKGYTPKRFKPKENLFNRDSEFNKDSEFTDIA